jgi:hypothetical protein
MKRTVSLILAIFIAASINGQLVVVPDIYPSDAVNNILLGEGVVVSSITYTGSPMQMGTFTGLTGVGISAGIVLSSGAVKSAEDSVSVLVGDTYSGDLDLYQLIDSQGSIYDLSSLEFDFVPLGNYLDFNFVFGSNEYPEFVYSNFFDPFGFFISGPGINGPYSNGAVNIAVVPDTDPPMPVTIDTVNDITNSDSYVSNPNHDNIHLDGHTTIFTASLPNVTPGSIYYVKLVIADASDHLYDSFVFLDEGSFSSSLVVNGSLVDFDSDGFVDVNDLFVLIANYGCTGSGCPADVNGDQIVNVLDVQVFIAAFGGAVDE